MNISNVQGGSEIEATF